VITYEWVGLQMGLVKGVSRQLGGPCLIPVRHGNTLGVASAWML
jgi:hypothetical protein